MILPSKNDLEKILGNARDLLRLVNQLLDFRRLEQKGEQLKLLTVQIKPFIEDNVNHFCQLAYERHIGLSCECAFGQEDLFRLDAEKMTRVLNNLLSNAMKFTPEAVSSPYKRVGRKVPRQAKAPTASASPSATPA